MCSTTTDLFAATLRSKLKMSIYVPRLQKSFTSPEINKAIEGSVKCLGYQQIRTEQLDVVTKFIEGNDVFVSLPTGVGKSLCFACLPLVYDYLRGVINKSIAIIVSPLNALMQDQVAKFTNRGMTAVYVGSECCSSLVDRVTNGEVQLTYMSPETILSIPNWREMFRNKHYQENLICLAVDEAHLIDKWCVLLTCAFMSYLGSIVMCKHKSLLAFFPVLPTLHMSAYCKAIKTVEPKAHEILDVNVMISCPILIQITYCKN